MHNQTLDNITGALDEALTDLRRLHSESSDPFFRGWIVRTYDQVSETRRSLESMAHVYPLVEDIERSGGGSVATLFEAFEADQRATTTQ